MRPIVYEELKVGDKVVTRDGRKGRVICTDVKNKNYPVICLITGQGGEETAELYTAMGGFAASGRVSDFDIFLPPKKEYVNLYSAGYRDWDAKGSYSSEQEALEAADKHYKNSKSWQFIKTIEVEL